MKASINTTVTFLIVGFGMMTFIFFGINTFLDISYSADVATSDLELLETIDATHMYKKCLEHGDGEVSIEEIRIFDGLECEIPFPGLYEINFDFLIKDIEKNEVLKQSEGYESESTRNRHSIAIMIHYGDEVDVGRLYVQRE